MKKVIKKGILLFIFITLISIFLPSSARAYSYKSDYISIDDDSFKYTDEEISITKLEYTDMYDEEETESIDEMGYQDLIIYASIDGEIKNNSDYILDAYITIDYYDANYQLAARTSSSRWLHEKNKADVFFHDLCARDFINDINYKDIKYFRISVETEKDGLLDHDSDYPSSYSYDSHDYVIDKYDVLIIVNEDNSYDITETITANFLIDKHGIIRKIPMINNITRLDGSTSVNRARISNISVNEKYSKKIEDFNLNLKIGNANKTITGNKKYVIKYKYSLGKDPLKDKDELYFNIIGTEWDTTISNITFKIVMPKEFDPNELGFSSGYLGSTDSSSIEYNVDGNTITGKYINNDPEAENKVGTLNSGEGITVRCELPEGYFKYNMFEMDFIDYIIIIAPFLCLAYAVKRWRKYGKDEKAIDTVEFYPPKGFNSLEVAYLYKGQVTTKDVTSLLIYLANKGYIKITELENKKKLGGKSKSFKITRLKMYDGSNEEERIFLSGLFSKGKVNPENNKLEIELKDLEDKFYTTTNRILNKVNNKKNRSKIYELPKSNALLIIMIAIIFAVINIRPSFGGSEIGFTLFLSVFPAMGLVAIASIYLNNSNILVNEKPVTAAFWKILACVLIFIPMLLFPMGVTYYNSLPTTPIHYIEFVIGMTCIAGMLVCIKYMPKRNAYGTEILGKIKGFKEFLEVSEKEKLEALVEKDPTYFYDILPYTYVLGVSSKWIKKFEDISFQAPKWYDGSGDFNTKSFGSFVNSTMKSAEEAMISSPVSSSGGGYSGGGGFSGGGSSGGGSGGGGGSSW